MSIEIGSKWVHHSGRKYEVVLVSNQHSTNIERYPITITYRGPNDRVWSKPIDRFLDTMEPDDVSD